MTGSQGLVTRDQESQVTSDQGLVTGMPVHGIAIIYTPRRFPMIMRRTIPTEPSEPVEPAEPLSHAIKGRHALWVNPEP